MIHQVIWHDVGVRRTKAWGTDGESCSSSSIASEPGKYILGTTGARCQCRGKGPQGDKGSQWLWAAEAYRAMLLKRYADTNHLGFLLKWTFWFRVRSEKSSFLTRSQRMPLLDYTLNIKEHGFCNHTSRVQITHSYRWLTMWSSVSYLTSLFFSFLVQKMEIRWGFSVTWILFKCLRLLVLLHLGKGEGTGFGLGC